MALKVIFTKKHHGKIYQKLGLILKYISLLSVIKNLLWLPMQQVSFRLFFFLTVFSLGSFSAQGQNPLSFDLKKPEKFENKTLGYEKTDQKKFTAPRRFIQNTVTHYNWYFNANNKLNEIVDRAKSFHQDDFSALLPFYNYSIETTVRDSVELDSVIYKANAGILIHDLRNAWIDNLFMLMGKAYFFQNKLDSAYITFQFINYAFSPKEKDGYQQPIGSNAAEGGNAFNVSTKENNSLLQKAISTPPSRNEAFIWQIKTFIENNEYSSAAALIETIRLDPQFPERLFPDLNEVRALLHYRLNNYDSSAYYLEHALPNAGNKRELSRWEYLIAQLYERAGNPAEAQKFYARAIDHTLDPVMEVYARLNSIRQNKGDSLAINRNIAELVKMGRKDRYSRYRDIIYFMAAQMELERKNVVAARNFLLKSTLYTDPNRNASQRGKAFMMLGDLSYASQNYAEAKRFYDSVSAGDPAITDPESFVQKTSLLAQIVEQESVISRQDSLQRLASLPEAEREAIIRKKLRALRKAQGMQEEETINATAGALIPIGNTNQGPSDLFGPAEKGEWYFYNPSLKSKGFTSFRSKWGNRPNVDNWRRASSINAAKSTEGSDPGLLADGRGVDGVSTELSYEAMLKNIPLSAEAISASNDSVEVATLSLGRIFLEGLEDYSTVIRTVEPFPGKYEKSNRVPEALYYLYYSYKKNGEDQKAAEALRYLQEKFAGDPYERRISNLVNGNEDKSAQDKMTGVYNKIYNFFIEGRFDQALLEKQLADSLYGDNYWSPQLLYIESVYHIRQRDDAKAREVLDQLITMFPESPMKEKAVTLLDVVGRRAEIEDYLTKLQIERPAEDSIVIIEDKPAPPKPQVVIRDAQATKVESAKKNVTVDKQAVSASKDSAEVKKTAPIVRAYTYNPDAAQYVVIVTDNVDPVYVNEARNAFNRYNQTKFYNKKIDILNQPLNDSIKLVVMSGFTNSAEALDYLEKTKPIAAAQIVPWLPAEKYSFLMISAENLDVLKTLQSLKEYRLFLNKYYPGKF